MIKKLLSIFCCVALLAAMGACGNAGFRAGNTSADDKGDAGAPVIESIKQTSGTGGDIVDIYVNYDASKFSRDDFKILLDGEVIELTTKYLSGKQYEFALPLNIKAGKRTIAVMLGEQKSNEVGYEILAPEITSISLSEISFVFVNKATLEIKGSNLGFSADKVKVTLAGQELAVEAVSKESISVLVQKGAASGDLVVTVDGKDLKTFPITIKNE